MIVNQASMSDSAISHQLVIFVMPSTGIQRHLLDKPFVVHEGWVISRLASLSNGEPTSSALPSLGADDTAALLVLDFKIDHAD
jgi:hypothetical protein